MLVGVLVGRRASHRRIHSSRLSGVLFLGHRAAWSLEVAGKVRGLVVAGAATRSGHGGHEAAITEATSHETDDGNRETHAPKHTSQRLRRRAGWSV